MLEVSFVETRDDEHPVVVVNRLLFDVSDADLAAELIKNCPEAQRLAVERFAPQVRRLLRRSLGQENDVEDLEQEVFLCLFRRIRALKEPGSLRPFIMAIALRSVFHEQRRRRRFAHVTLEPELAQIGPATKRDEAVASYALARLGKLVFGLPKRERSTFLLRFVEGMTVTEIAHALQLSEATTRRSFNRAWLSVSKRAARDLFLSDYFGGTPCSIEVD